jgi:hypothetical protein
MGFRALCALAKYQERLSRGSCSYEGLTSRVLPSADRLYALYILFSRAAQIKEVFQQSRDDLQSCITVLRNIAGNLENQRGFDLWVSIIPPVTIKH